MLIPEEIKAEIKRDMGIEGKEQLTGEEAKEYVARILEIAGLIKDGEAKAVTPQDKREDEILKEFGF